jgi:hypothetical protein
MNLLTIRARNFYFSKNKIKGITPWFITGFVDAEGCFNMKISKDKTHYIGWSVSPRFLIGLHKKDLALLKEIQTFFGGIGKIHSSKNTAIYSVSRQKDIFQYIVPHFDSYPLQSSKILNYSAWKKSIFIIQAGKHKTAEGLK